MKKHKHLIFVLLMLVVFSCKNENNKEQKNDYSVTNNYLIGKKIKPMSYAVNPYYKIDSAKLHQEWQKPYKIIVYGDLYCTPCWQNFLLWKKHYHEFTNYKNLVILFYLHCSPEDFDKYSLKDSVNFPVILDNSNRFRIVNSISNVHKEQTFLLDSSNKIIAVGQPFASEIKSEYLKLISQ